MAQSCGGSYFLVGFGPVTALFADRREMRQFDPQSAPLDEDMQLSV